MNTREYVNSLFTDDSLINARSREIDLSVMASSTAVVQVPVTIELPAFVAHALEAYKKDSGVKLEDLLEELILNKILKDEHLIGKMLNAWERDQRGK